MPDMNLQERISLYTIEAYKSIGREVGQKVTPEEINGLKEDGKIDAFIALNIQYVRQLAHLHDTDLTENAPCYEVFEGLMPAIGEKESMNYSIIYLFAMHYFMTPKERTIMVMDIEDAIHDNVPHIKEILSKINMTPKQLERTNVKFK